MWVEKIPAAKRPQVAAPSKVAPGWPGPVTEGTHFEVILRDGVPIREAWKSFNKGGPSTRFDKQILLFFRAGKA